MKLLPIQLGHENVKIYRVFSSEVPSIAPVDSTQREKKVHVQKVAYVKIEGATGS